MIQGSEHKPVLTQEVVDTLQIVSEDVAFDGTIGLGGHAEIICSKLGRDGVYMGIDLDPSSLIQSNRRLSGISPAEIFLFEDNYKNIKNILKKTKKQEVSKALLDLGWNTYQLQNSNKGFSFQKDEPLKMTYGNPTSSLFTAEDIVNEWEEENMADIIYNYSDEIFSRPIAKAIVNARKVRRIRTSLELAKIIEDIAPGRRKIHPATKTFQALRITVNDEMGALKKGLPDIWDSLSEKGRFAVITFHSIEDRIVKNFFRDKKNEGVGKIINKKVIKASDEEIKNNPSSRSAKLRVIEKK